MYSTSALATGMGGEEVVRTLRVDRGDRSVRRRTQREISRCGGRSRLIQPMSCVLVDDPPSPRHRRGALPLPLDDAPGQRVGCLDPPPIRGIGQPDSRARLELLELIPRRGEPCLDGSFGEDWGGCVRANAHRGHLGFLGCHVAPRRASLIRPSPFALSSIEHVSVIGTCCTDWLGQQPPARRAPCPETRRRQRTGTPVNCAFVGSSRVFHRLLASCAQPFPRRASVCRQLPLHRPGRFEQGGAVPVARRSGGALDGAGHRNRGHDLAAGTRHRGAG